MIPHITDLNTIGNDTFVAEGTYGYGDIVGATAYALNCNYSNICFVWFDNRQWSPPTKRYHEKDPETTLERTNFIVRKMSKLIGIFHVRKEIFDKRPPSSYKNRYHDTLHSFLDESKDQGHIALWTSKHNVDQIHFQPKRRFKDPIHHDKIFNALSITDLPIQYVSYRDPIHVTFEKIRTASICIGYEGIGQLIAKNYFKPTITFSRGTISQSTTGEWGVVTDSLDDRVINIEKQIEEQKRMICTLTEQ
jgi:hypothetical protein